ncbi:MAG: 4-hydroxybenzoate polyprenyltransferase, mitochondrial [Chlamydiales bacterium]|nr:4-hydroxybenzoate polyprenyltransferase, mitochondrial [Chlamydiales bacterium]
MRFSAFCEVTRLEQTLFALPFVLAGALLAFMGPHLNGWVWVLPAFLLARISGMAFNQLIDRKIDAANPRTQNRAIPSGRVSLLQARFIAWSGLSVFLLVCVQINLLCALLAPFAALLIYLYSYMKRIHASCHFVLGAIHCLGPIMAFAAIKGTLDWAPVLLGLAAGCLIIGNDIAYAMQDYAFDCSQRLHSLPASLGIQKSVWVGKLIHALCPLMLFGVGLVAHFPFIYFLLVFFVGGILLWFHSKLNKYIHTEGSAKGIEPLFFTCNVAISFSSLFFILMGVIWVALL